MNSLIYNEEFSVKIFYYFLYISILPIIIDSIVIILLDYYTRNKLINSNFKLFSKGILLHFPFIISLIYFGFFKEYFTILLFLPSYLISGATYVILTKNH